MVKNRSIKVDGLVVRVTEHFDSDYICLTDMVKAKDGEFFIADWLRNRNTLEFLAVWEQMNNPDFNYGEFAIIAKSSGLNNFKISVAEWIRRLKYVSDTTYPDAQAIEHERTKLSSYNSACTGTSFSISTRSCASNFGQQKSLLT